MTGFGGLTSWRTTWSSVDPELVLLGHRLQFGLDPGLDLLPADGEHFRNRAVADDLAHDRLVHRAKRAFGVTHLEEVLVRIRHAVLDDPFDDRDVEIAREHHRFVVEVALRVLGPDAGFFRAEPELLLQLPLHRHLDDLFSERCFEVQPGLGGANVTAEAQHDPDRLRGHLIKGRREQHDRRDEAGCHARRGPGMRGTRGIRGTWLPH